MCDLEIERLAWSVAEVMEKLGVGKTFMFDLLAEGKIGSIKVRGRRLITKEHLETFLEGE